jgi:hypothetical protein
VSFAVVAVLLASPVVKVSAGSGLIVDDGVLLTTSAVARETGRPEGQIAGDGGTVTLGSMVELDLDLAVVGFKGAGSVAELERGVVDAGTRLRALTGDAEYEVTVVAVKGTELELSMADAGVVAGAALVDEADRVWGLVRDEHHAVSSAAVREVLEEAQNPQKGRAAARWRNLGISAAFFLGLSVWWVYRSKRRRY